MSSKDTSSEPSQAGNNTPAADQNEGQNQRRDIKFTGFKRDYLSDKANTSIDKFFEPGGSAEQKLGRVTRVRIKSGNHNHAVHPSTSNTKDKTAIIAAWVVGSRDKKTCHIYPDGTGTTKKSDDRL